MKRVAAAVGLFAALVVGAGFASASPTQTGKHARDEADRSGSAGAPAPSSSRSRSSIAEYEKKRRT